jgi:hypothetical protein
MLVDPTASALASMLVLFVCLFGLAKFSVRMVGRVLLERDQ